MNYRTLTFSLVLATASVFATSAGAQTPFAGEDFDGGVKNGGLTGPTSSLFTPDNSASGTTFPAGFAGGSFFDRFGVVSRSLEGGSGDSLPFDFMDESAGGFAADLMGIVDSTKADDNVVVLVDTQNSQNPGGTVTAEWTFDISGRQNLGLSVELAAIGDFDSDDFFRFEYSIDGGATKTAIEGQVDEVFNPEFEDFSTSLIPYGLELESGTFTDRYLYPTAFFQESEWFDVIDGVAGPGLTLHPRDNGMDGDATAGDGFIPVTFLSGTEEIRAYTDGSFDQTEFLAYRDPLFVNPTTPEDGSGNNFATGTQLDNEFREISAALEGTGSTLTLTFTGFTNDSAGQEFIAFDNIVLSELPAMGLDGDYNGDGEVDAADYVVWRNGDSPDSSPTGLAVWKANYGATASSAAIPEPASLALLGLAAAAAATRRV